MGTFPLGAPMNKLRQSSISAHHPLKHSILILEGKACIYERDKKQLITLSDYLQFVY